MKTSIKDGCEGFFHTVSQRHIYLGNNFLENIHGKFLWWIVPSIPWKNSAHDFSLTAGKS